MLPSVNDLIKENENCYSFVIAIAKKARKIAEDANDQNVMLDEKPVKLAIGEYSAGKFHIVPPEDDETGEEEAKEEKKAEITDNNQIL